MRTRRLAVAAGVLAVLMITPSAEAKGPAGATIDGEGVEGTLTIDEPGEPGQGTAMSRLVEAVGFFELTFGESKRTLAESPTEALGKQRIVITWDMGSDEKIVQEVYHRAEGGPVTYIEPGQSFYDSAATVGGWYRVTGDIETPLVELGVSPDAFTTYIEAARESATNARPEPVTNAEPLPAATPTPMSSAVAESGGSVTQSGSTVDGGMIAALVLALAVVVAAAGTSTWMLRRRPMPH